MPTNHHTIVYVMWMVHAAGLSYLIYKSGTSPACPKEISSISKLSTHFWDIFLVEWKINNFCAFFCALQHTETYQMAVNCTQFKWWHVKSTEMHVQHPANQSRIMIRSYRTLNTSQKPFCYRIQFKSIVEYHKCVFAHVLTSKYLRSANTFFDLLKLKCHNIKMYGFLLSPQLHLNELPV